MTMTCHVIYKKNRYIKMSDCFVATTLYAEKSVYAIGHLFEMKAAHISVRSKSDR